MASLNVFKNSIFSATSLTAAVERTPFVPTLIGSMGLFTPNPVRTTDVFVESRDGKLRLIPFTTRGSPPGLQRETERRKGIHLEIPRLFHADTIFAHEIQDIRAFGSETELMQVEDEVARRLSGPTGILTNVEYTKEFMRLNALLGKVVDPGTKAVLYDMYAEMQITPAPVVDLGLDTDTPNVLRPKINQIIRDIARTAQGAVQPGTRIVALCGDAFYDALVNHPDVIRTFLNTAEAAELRGAQGAAFQSFVLSGVEWINYRGSDDGMSIAIEDDEAILFPVAPGLFQEALAPGESFDSANEPGKPVYVLPIPDRDRNMFWTLEAYSYPLYYCLRPEVLRRVRI